MLYFDTHNRNKHSLVCDYCKQDEMGDDMVVIEPASLPPTSSGTPEKLKRLPAGDEYVDVTFERAFTESKCERITSGPSG